LIGLTLFPADKRTGIRWNFTTVLEDLEFADDIALLSSRLNELHEKTGRLTEEAARVGLKLNARKCKTLRTEYASNRERIAVNGEEVEDVGEFPYLGATVDKEGGGSRDQATEGPWCVSEAREGMGSQRNRNRNQDTPIQDLSTTSPVIWLRDLEDHKG